MQDENDILFNEYSIDFLGIFRALFGGSGNGGVQDTGPTFFENLIHWAEIFWNVYSVLAYILSAALVYGIIYAFIRFSQLSEIEMENIRNEEHRYQEIYGGQNKNQRWEDIQKHIATDNPNDWKLAIIESDVMLAEALTTAGYAGTSIGEQLKGARSQAFNTLDQAWAAHLVRNKIAHQGPDFILTKKLAQETVTQYKMVFTEFGVI